MFLAGQQFGKYTLVRQLGQGAYGEVWLAIRQSKFVTTKVAIKLPNTAQIDFEAIRQEAILWEQASGHPNVVPIIEADEYDGQVVIVSEFASDGTLDDFLAKEHRLSLKKSVEMALGIAQGLEFLHMRRIIHRDIKPANILLQGETPRLTDFGMARIVLGTDVSLQISGTPYYMAPEAFSRKRNAQTDIWSFGVVLYEMLTGQMPFPGDEVAEIYEAILHKKPQPPPTEFPPSVSKVVLKTLAKTPADRYQTVREMREDLLLCLPDAANLDHYSVTGEKVSADSKFLKNSRFKKTDFFFDPVQSKKSRRLPAGFFSIGQMAAAFVLLMIAALAAAFFYNAPPPIPFRIGDKFGYGTRDKKIVLGAKYDLARPFSDDLALVALGNRESNGNFVGKFGFIDKDGNEIIPLNFEDAKSFSENLAAVKFQGKWGFIDKNSRTVIPFKYDSAESFSGGLAAVTLNNQAGFINSAGVPVIPLSFIEAESFKNNRARVKSADGKEFYIGLDGTQFYQP